MRPYAMADRQPPPWIPPSVFACGDPFSQPLRDLILLVKRLALKRFCEELDR